MAPRIDRQEGLDRFDDDLALWIITAEAVRSRHPRCGEHRGRRRGQTSGYLDVVHRVDHGHQSTLWNTVDTVRITKSSRRWGDGVSSTIHSPYHHYKTLYTKNQEEEVGTT